MSEGAIEAFFLRIDEERLKEPVGEKEENTEKMEWGVGAGVRPGADTSTQEEKNTGNGICTIVRQAPSAPSPFSDAERSRQDSTFDSSFLRLADPRVKEFAPLTPAAVVTVFRTVGRVWDIRDARALRAWRIPRISRSSASIPFHGNDPPPAYSTANPSSQTAATPQESDAVRIARLTYEAHKEHRKAEEERCNSEEKKRGWEEEDRKWEEQKRGWEEADSKGVEAANTVQALERANGFTREFPLESKLDAVELLQADSENVVVFLSLEEMMRLVWDQMSRRPR
ncbi:hypothetical protein BDK51DRAFT_48413 [Blyttiomyces helicus]|uniref:Uncharacterized protein n=1 Tax=Blyttiomyces helicus TaxID=388810 RepID=A0A4P9WL90_9FUNG|nr:hypothetical protein BDK51DRAFT_48413 [Blyttiomyces helicus]|eukprot:RKO92925.1 hypothetical protein BDK51DRAFT_48413 [Blyttiomyces helicus]